MKTPPIISKDDDELVARLRTGAPQAVEELVSRYRSRLYALAYRWTRNHHDAQEVVQETFLRAYRAAPRFRGDSALGSWLHAIVTNVARNRYWRWRRRKGDITVSLDSLADVPDANPCLDGPCDALAVIERDDLEHRIEESIQLLTERDRRILYLRTREHASYEEMARILGIAIGTVKSRLARAREHLRNLLATERECSPVATEDGQRSRGAAFARDNRE